MFPEHTELYIVLYTCTLHTHICNQYTKVFCTTNLHTLYVELCTKHLHVERHTQKHCPQEDVVLHIFAHTGLSSCSTLQVSVYMSPHVLWLLHEMHICNLCKRALRTHPLCSGKPFSVRSWTALNQTRCNSPHMSCPFPVFMGPVTGPRMWTLSWGGFGTHLQTCPGNLMSFLSPLDIPKMEDRAFWECVAIRQIFLPCPTHVSACTHVHPFLLAVMPVICRILACTCNRICS